MADVLSMDGQRFYFENQHGEQWYAFLSNRLVVTGEDINWKVLTLHPKDLRKAQRDLTSGFFSFQGIAMASDERKWIQSLLETAKAQWETAV